MTAPLPLALSAITMPDPWLVAAFAVVLALGAAIQWALGRSRFGRSSPGRSSGRSHSSRSGRSEGRPDGRVDGFTARMPAQDTAGVRPAAPPAVDVGGRGDERVDAMDLAIRNLTTELRTLRSNVDEWSDDHQRRLERLEREVRPAVVPSSGLIDLPAGRPASAPAPAYESASYQPGGGWGAAATAAAEVPQGALPVEVRDDQVRSSASYPPEAYLAEGSPARLFLNTEIQMSEAAVRRFMAFFDFPSFQGGSAFFRTRRPADVSWNGSQGTCLARGTVEAL